MTLSPTVFCSTDSRCLVLLTHFCFCKLSAILCSLAKSTAPSLWLTLHPLHPRSIKRGVWTSATAVLKTNLLWQQIFSDPPLFWRVRGPLAEFWAVTQRVAAQPGALPSHHYRTAHPRTECLYQDPLWSSSRFTLRSSGNGFIWSRDEGWQKMGWRP